MKKLLIVTLVALLAIALVAGCGQQKPQEQTPPAESKPQQPAENQEVSYNDGVYYVEKADFDDHGWKAMVTVVVKDGKIAGVYFDEINEDGVIKSFDTEYASNMKAKSGTTPLDAYNELEVSLISKQNPENVDAVTGATHSSDSFKEMVKEALAGSPVEAAGTYKDGLYKAAEKDFDDHGWKAIAAVIIKDGKVVTAAFDETNKDDGRYKSVDEEYASNMEEKSGTTPAKAIQALSNSLIDKQDAAAVDLVTGATGTADKFKTLMGEVLSLAK